MKRSPHVDFKKHKQFTRFIQGARRAPSSLSNIIPNMAHKLHLVAPKINPRCYQGHSLRFLASGSFSAASIASNIAINASASRDRSSLACLSLSARPGIVLT